MIALGLTLLVGFTACTGGGGGPTPTPSAPGTGPTLGSVAAFQAFSGLTIPSSAAEVAINVTVDAAGQPAYRVKFTLPSSGVDQFCRDGQMNRPLRVTTIPASFRQTFDYQGDSSTGVAIAEASLPSNVNIQRQVFAVDMSKATAKVQVYAYELK